MKIWDLVLVIEIKRVGSGIMVLKFVLGAKRTSNIQMYAPGI